MNLIRQRNTRSLFFLIVNFATILLCIIAYGTANARQITDRNLDLFKYNPSDIYTLPEDIDDDKPAVIYNGDVMKARVEKLQSFNTNNKFKLDLKTQNGIEVTSVGKLKDDKTFVVSGSYSFTGADGKRYKTRYTADEFGYHPITELELDIPEPQPLLSAASTFENSFSSLDKPTFGKFSNNLKNRFQFLNQNLDRDAQSPIRGSGQSGDDYSFLNSQDNNYPNRDSDNYYNANNNYNTDRNGDDFGNGNGNGYAYEAPSIQLNSPLPPSNQYLPAL